jgi:hypothetical protein
MPQSSESVAALGGALAKAQAELVNPEKLLTASISTGRGGEGHERTFRYASLASGLDIVRKTLGQHEIATVQTTTVDQSAGLVNLTTMLVHASGEWIASDWPVCPISDLASPRRMGAALTYARRYALFTLVGIAGEDDLDAPDLQDQAAPKSPTPANRAGKGLASKNGSGAGHLNKILSTPSGNGHDGRRRRGGQSVPPVILASDQSVELRDRLMGELVAISSAEQATDWARKSLPAKNTLAVTDAEIVEQAFERRLTEFSEAADADAEPVTNPEQGRGKIPKQRETLQDSGGQPQPEEPADIGAEQANLALDSGTVESTRAAPHGPPPGVDKSVLALSEPKRHRNREHLRFVAQQPCLICARTPSDPHHLRFAQARTLGRKVSDEFVVPLCRSHHRALHRVGNEQGWWRAAEIDPLEVASKLWGQSRLTETPGSEPIPAVAPPPGAVAAPRLRARASSRRDEQAASKRGGPVATNGRAP